MFWKANRGVTETFVSFLSLDFENAPERDGRPIEERTKLLEKATADLEEQLDLGCVPRVLIEGEFNLIKSTEDALLARAYRQLNIFAIPVRRVGLTKN